MELSDEQQLAFNKYKLGENIFITGPGGSGKSLLIREIVDDAKNSGTKVQVCALTGTAAVILQCGAKTVHSWGGIGLANGDMKAVANKVNKSRYKKRNWLNVDLLIIDEVSMMSLKLFELLEWTARLCRKNVKPFGGIQVLFTGDFYQLPPVGKSEEPETCQFCFESPLWNTIFPNQIQLVRIFRQEDDLYKKILNQIRIGRLSKSVVSKLKDYVGRKVDTDAKILPTILYPTRKRVDEMNTRSLNNLSSEEKVFDYQQGKPEEITLTEEQKAISLLFNSDQCETEIKYMIDNINFDKRLVLKVGAQVMCVANLDMDSENPICNGSQGVVESFTEQGIPIVHFKNGVIRQMHPHIWQSETIPTVAIKQIPLILAWAITIHKSQGATLDHAEIDIGRGIFECGQTYVALSRVRSLDGLYLKSFDPNKILINKKVRDYYEGL